MSLVATEVSPCSPPRVRRLRQSRKLPAPTPVRLERGAQVDGRYVLLEPIGRGGAGLVWRARHRTIPREFAIKFLGPEPPLDRVGAHDATEALREEARTLSKINHPNVVKMVDFGFAGPGQPYAVMELLRGRTLGAELRAGPVPWAKARPWIRDLLFGLGATHRAGIVHGDITPANVFIEHADDNVKLIDFGLARPANAGPLAAVIGTPPYMSPERIRADAVDARSDLYAWACVVYHMLTGAAPFQGSGTERLAQHLSAPPRPPQLGADVPEQVGPALMSCLAKKPEERPSSAAELAAALLEPATPKPPPVPKAAGTEPKRRGLLAWWSP